MKRDARLGFTLMELLVVIAILGVVTTIGTVTLVQLWAHWGELKSASRLDERADAVFASMHEDFAAMVASSTIGVALQGAPVTEKDPQFYMQQLAGDKFTVPVEVPTPNGTVTAIVGYQIERKDGRSYLMRTEKQLRGGVQLPPRELAKGVVQMRVEYAGAGGGWADNWSQPGNPRAVRVSLLLVNPNHPHDQQIARQAVLAVHVP